MKRYGLLLLVTLSSTASAEPQALINAAREQIGVTVEYDGRYQRISYPNGDVPNHTGVCTDVIIRAYRTLGIDLQRRVHEDMRAHFSAYPRLWGLTKPDANIDHRRVPNLQKFFQRHGQSLPVSSRAENYLPGDLVTWMLPGNLPHIGIVSEQKNAKGVPLIIHNIGRGTRQEDVLFAYPMTGHYRYGD